MPKPPIDPEHAAPIGRLLARFAGTGLVALMLAAPFTMARADDLQDVSKLVSTGKIDEAEKRADAFLAKTPKDAQMRFLKGVILAQRGKRAEAVAMFTGITQDYPELPEPYNNLAVIYAAQGQYDNARGALETAVRVSPNYATAYENLGDVYAALAARSYEDARRYDGGNAGALRKLTATRAMLTAAPAAAAPSTPVASTPVPPSAPAEAIRSQRNVGLPSPAGPRVTVGGTGAVAPEIVVPANAAEIPQGSNVVAIETRSTDVDRASTSVLPGVTTIVDADPAQPIAAVTAAVSQWAQAHSVATDDLRVRIDGDTAIARFREAAKGAPTVNRALTLKRDGAAWHVTEARGES
ncbi:MAG: tetratricopeptide repeat protein [Burkholderiaceae bacterium]